MSIYNSRYRFFRSLVTAAALAAVYVGFRGVTAPFLDIEPRKHQTKSTRTETVADSTAESDADKWFPKHSWVANAREQYFDKGRVL